MGEPQPGPPPESVRDLKEALDRIAGDQGWKHRIVVLPPAEPQAVLCDALFIAEVRHLPDGTDETNEVRVRVTADHVRPVPASLEANLVSVVKSHLPAAEDGWHSPARCAEHRDG